MKTALPENAKIAKEAKECMQECVSEFISFITSEGMSIHALAMPAHNANISTASEKCHQEKRKTVNGEDILFAMTSLGFENYAEALKIYLSKYREVSIHASVFQPHTDIALQTQSTRGENNRPASQGFGAAGAGAAAANANAAASATFPGVEGANNILQQGEGEHDSVGYGSLYAPQHNGGTGPEGY